jgi:hypothetical protein
MEQGRACGACARRAPGTPIASCIRCNPGLGDDAPISYERHEPEKTLLYHAVREHLEPFLERSRSVGAPIPRRLSRGPAARPGPISCRGCSRLMRCDAQHAAVGCESCRRSRSPTWRAGSWNFSTYPHGLRRSANRKEGPPSCRARSRHPICPGTTTSDSTSTSRVQTTVDRRPLIRERAPLGTSNRDDFEECRSPWAGPVDSLARASTIPRAIARRERPGRAPSLKSPPEGAE